MGVADRARSSTAPAAVLQPSARRGHNHNRSHNSTISTGQHPLQAAAAVAARLNDHEDNTTPPMLRRFLSRGADPTNEAVCPLHGNQLQNRPIMATPQAV